MSRNGPLPPTPRVQIAGGAIYGNTLTMSEYAALTGTSLDNAYDAARAGTTPVPPIKLSASRWAFSTVAVCKLLDLDYEIITPVAVSEVGA